MSDITRSRTGKPAEAAEDPGGSPRLGLLIAWSLDEPGRVGEIVLAPQGKAAGVLGRGAGEASDPAPRLPVVRARPSSTVNTGPLLSPGVSRLALRIEADGAGLSVERLGKAPLRLNGRVVPSGKVRLGDRVALDGEMLFLCVERRLGSSGQDNAAFRFGEADPFGLVGESAALWQARDLLAFYAEREGHVLVSGPSGTGKELAARALHTLSTRRGGPFVARSAATLPPGIADAELFGNAVNFPNAGMRERPGLVGEADGGTLFFDELGEFPESLQAHLLRLLDGGEYHRLGEGRPRVSNLRFIGATNRGTEGLKHDLVARLKMRLVMPGLSERRDDIPLLVRSRLGAMASRDSGLARRFFGPHGARLAPELIDALLRHRYTTHVRELESLLLLSMATSKGDQLSLTPQVEEEIVSEALEPPDRRQIEEALDRAGGNVSRAYRDLGLSSRDALNRLIRKYNIDVRGRRDG